MSNIKDQIYDILSLLPYDVFKTKIDPLIDSYQMPGISVQNREINRKLVGDQIIFDTDNIIDIYVILDSPTDYDTLLETVVEIIISTLLTNATFMAQFSNQMSVNTVYEYSAQGDKNLAKARITFVGQYREQFDPNITAMLNTLSTGWDFRNTMVDPNINNGSPIGPDGRIEASGVYTTV